MWHQLPRPSASTQPTETLLCAMPAAPVPAKPVWMANIDLNRTYFALSQQNFFCTIPPTAGTQHTMLTFILPHRCSSIYLPGVVYMPHFESTVTKRHMQIVLLSELCLRMTEIHLLKMYAVALLQKISMHNKTEAQPSTCRGYLVSLLARQEQ